MTHVHLLVIGTLCLLAGVAIRSWGNILCLFGKHIDGVQFGNVRHCKRCGWGLYVDFRIRARYAWFGLWD